MAWIDFKKAYDMVPHSWIIKTLSTFGIADNVIRLLRQSMSYWKTKLFANGTFLGTVKIKRGIFQGDAFSPLLFVIALIPLTYILRETNMGYQLKKGGSNINHMLFMDDMKIFGKSDNEVDSMVKTVQQCSSDIGMEFGIAKCAVITMKRGKRTVSRGIKLPNGEEMGDPENGGYKYLGILELDKVLCDEMKEKVRNVYFKRLKLLLKTKLNNGNLFSAINAWAVAIIRYSAAFIGWTKEELKEMDRATRKLIKNFGGLHPRSCIQRLYMKRCNGGRGLIGIEECVAGELRTLHYYLVNSSETLLQNVAEEYGVAMERVEEKETYKKRVEQEKREIFINRTLHGQFERDTKELKVDESWNWLKKGFLKRETESLLVAAQEQALNTNSVKNGIYGMDISNKCRLCKEKVETPTHIVSGCKMLAQKEYKRRHDKVCLNLHWLLCKKYNINVSERWYQHHPESVVENEEVKIMWDMLIQCDRYIEHRRPDIVVVEKVSNKCKIIDVACPNDYRLEEKREEKLRNYSELQLEVSRMWNKSTRTIPIIIGALGSIPSSLESYLEQLGVRHNMDILQQSVLLGTANTIRKVLSMT